MTTNAFKNIDFREATEQKIMEEQNMNTATNQHNKASEKIIDFNKTLITLSNDLKKMRGFYDKLNLENVASIDRALHKIEEHSFSVAVVGEFKRGKSTFINALLQRDILPADVRPCSATLNRITYGLKPQVKIIFKDDREEEIDINCLKDYVTKLTKDSATKASEVAEAVIFYPLPYCENNVEIIDTPGLNDDENMTEVTYSVLPKVDAAIMLMMAASPFSDTERKFLEEKLLSNDLGRIIVVLNAIDRCNTREDAERIVEYVRERIEEYVIERAKENYGEDSPEYEIYQKKIGTPKVYGVSAYQALQAKKGHDNDKLTESHFPEFETALEKFLIEERGATFLQVPVNRALSSAQEILKAISLRENALKMDREKFEEAYEKSKKEIDDLRQRKSEEVKKTDGAAEKLTKDVFPLIERLEGDLKQATDQVIKTTVIKPNEFKNKKALAKNLNDKISSAVQKVARKLSEQIQEKIEKALVQEIERLQDFAQSIDQALKNIEINFLSIDANTQAERNAIGKGVTATLAVYTGLGGIYSGYQEAGFKGVLVGGGGSVGTFLATGFVAGLIGLPVTFPVVIVAGILSYFTGGWLTKAVFGGEMVERFKENYRQEALKQIEEQLRKSRIEQIVQQQIYQAFEALKHTVYEEAEAIMKNTEQNLAQALADRERNKAITEKELQELDEMRIQTKQIQGSAQRLSQQFIQNVNVIETSESFSEQ
jgi:GTPase SAR1 family protein